jgi:hypothetical protein
MLGGVRGFYPYSINSSCRFNDNDSARLERTPGAAGTEETFTFAAWIKRANITSVMQIFNAAAGNELQFTAADKLQFTTASATLLTTAVYRDNTNWYHIVLAVDTTQATAADRVNLYVNGTEVTAFDTETYPTLDEVTEFSKAAVHHICSNEGDTEEFDGYLAEAHFIDGTQVAASSFGQFKNGVWVPVRYTGSYGTQGFYLDFAVAPGTGNGAGTDVSGNGNHWTDANLTAADQVEDSPTNNYPTLHQLYGATMSNGNLDYAATSDHHAQGAILIPKSGKWYWEVTAGSSNCKIGILPTDTPMSWYTANPVGSRWYYGADGNYYITTTGQGYGAATFGSTDVIGVLVDMDSGDLTFYKNNSTQGSAESIDNTQDWVPYFGSATAGQSMDVNFGQLGFTYTPPSGYRALSVANIPEPSVLIPDKAMDATLWAGNSTDDRDITGLSFQPDLVWIKDRTGTNSHSLYDSVRGAGNNSELTSESTAIEGGNNADLYGYLSAFNSDGYRLKAGTDASPYGYVNVTGNNYVGWSWKESSTYGFDIVSYTGTGTEHAESHNLGAVPEMIIVKNRDQADSWAVYHHHALGKVVPETDHGTLDTDAAWADNNTLWDDTAPTSTHFRVGTSHWVNASAENYIGYLFRSIEGYSKVFSYEGNANANGPFIYLGFRAKVVLLKSADGVYSWWILDSERDTYNVVSLQLKPDANGAEVDADRFDIVSNGLKLRTSSAGVNSAHSFVGIAFAELPGKYSNAR